MIKNSTIKETGSFNIDSDVRALGIYAIRHGMNRFYGEGICLLDYKHYAKQFNPVSSIPMSGLI